MSINRRLFTSPVNTSGCGDEAINLVLLPALTTERAAVNV